MKALLFLLGTLALLAVLPAQGEEPRRSGRGLEVLPPGLHPPASHVTNDEAFRAKRNAKGSTVPKPMPMRPKSYSITDLSVFIVHGESHTILPKGSVIFCPDAISARVSNKAVGKPMAWNEFLVANRNWISTHEVTLAQVRGEAPLTEGDRKSFAIAGRVVVATLRGNPVTVLPVPTPVEQP